MKLVVGYEMYNEKKTVDALSDYCVFNNITDHSSNRIHSSVASSARSPYANSTGVVCV